MFSLAISRTEGTSRELHCVSPSASIEFLPHKTTKTKKQSLELLIHPTTKLSARNQTKKCKSGQREREEKTDLEKMTVNFQKCP